MAGRGAPKGNQNAARGKQWRAALEVALARAAPKGNRTVAEGLAPIANKVVKAAMDGDKDAWQEIANRMDGRPAQSVTVGGDGDNPLVIQRLERIIVDPKAEDQD